MQSTDNNLNNPLRVGDIDLAGYRNLRTDMSINVVTQEVYDLMQCHDPLVVYVISDAIDGRIYIGDHLVLKENISSKYFIGIDPKTTQYVLYLNMVEQYQDHLIPVSKYANPNEAMQALLKANDMGSLNNIHRGLATKILAYIDNTTSINDLIIGILCAFGYKDDPRLQNIIMIVNHYTCDNINHQSELQEVLHFHEWRKVNPLFVKYTEVYNLIVKYGFFTGAEYRNPEINLDKPIADIIKIFES